MPDEQTKPEKEEKAHPLWLRIVLMTLLLIFVCVAFYLTNQKIFEQLNRP